MNTDQIKEAIRTLEQLRLEGLISDEECAREKTQLLAQLRQSAVSASTSGGGIGSGASSTPNASSAPNAPPAPAAPVRGADLFMTGGAGIDRNAAMQATPPTQVLPPQQGGISIEPAASGGKNWAEGSSPQTIPSSGILGVGQVLRGRYRIVRLLGRGGMGEVYLVFDLVRERELALKRIHPQLANDPSIKARFLHELNVNEKLTHPGIVRTYAVDEDPETQTIFFTMEYVEGESLEQRLQSARAAQKEPPLALAETITILETLAEILDFAHKKGIVHRDLKPGNVMLTPQQEVKLMDFGLAKLLQDNQPQHHTGFVGTVYYMAPEQMRGGQVSHTADIYALGILTYQLLTGHLYQGGMPGPSGMLNTLPAEIDAIFSKSIHWKPEERYTNATEMIRALRSALASAGLIASGPTTSPPSPPTNLSSQIPQSPVFASEQTDPTLRLEAQEDWLSVCAFSLDSRFLATGSWDHSIAIWSLPSGDLKQIFIGHEDVVEACLFLPNGDLLSIDRGGLGLRWSIETPQPRMQGRIGEGGTTWSRWGEEICAFGWDGQIRQITSQLQSRSANALGSRALLTGDFSSISERYVASSEDGMLFVGKRLGPPEQTVALSSPALCLRFLPDGQRFLMGAEDGTVSLWGLPVNQPLLQMRGHDGPIRTCEVVRGGSVFVSGGEDGTLRFWSSQGRILTVGKAHTAPISDARVSPDGRWVASVGQDRVVCLWSIP